MKHRLYYRGWWIDRYLPREDILAIMDAIDHLLRRRFTLD